MPAGRKAMTASPAARRALARARVPALVAVVALAVACTPSAEKSADRPGAASSDAAAVGGAPSATPTLAPLAGRARADVMVWSDGPLTKAEIAALRKLSPGGFATVRVGDVRLSGRGQRTIGV